MQQVTAYQQKLNGNSQLEVETQQQPIGTMCLVEQTQQKVFIIIVQKMQA